jgi:hypothetical protein
MLGYNITEVCSQLSCLTTWKAGLEANKVPTATWLSSVKQYNRYQTKLVDPCITMDPFALVLS